jgi:hypothetical protein
MTHYIPRSRMDVCSFLAGLCAAAGVADAAHAYVLELMSMLGRSQA